MLIGVGPGKLAFLHADGAYDIHQQLDLSGEPLIPPLRKTFSLEEPFSAVKCQHLALEGRDYSQQYLDYWNSTAKDDGAY